MTAIVVGIDFGTTYSGFAYAYVADPNNVRTYTEWPGAEGYAKTVTQLLYSADGDLLAWGMPAVQRCAEMCERIRRGPAYFNAPPDVLAQARTERARRLPGLIRNFKMSIKNGEHSSQGDRVHIDEAEREYSVRKLVADYLRALKDYLLSYLSRGEGLVSSSDIRWCLTVPAIWEDSEKQFMRQAAYDAGLISDIDDQQSFRIVLEPEAAAIACIRDNKVRLEEVDTFMLVDAGGGTVDITVHERRGSNLVELVRGSGAACGSIYVDEQFKKFIAERLGSNVFRRLVTESPLSWLKMRQSWEVIKREWAPDSRRSFYISIERPLVEIVNDMRPNFFEDLRQLQDGQDDYILLTESNISEIFSPVLAKVVEVVKNQFRIVAEAGKSCPKLVLVGGFAESLALQMELKKNFPDVKVLVPKRPGSAVVLGAVLLGFDTIGIKRVARRTYGIAASLPFDSAIDPEGLRYTDPWGTERCRDRFSSFVKIGSQLEPGVGISDTFFTGAPKQKAITLMIYATEEAEPRYTSDRECIGELELPIPDPTVEPQDLVVTFLFGETELHVEAMDVRTGSKVKCRINYEGFR